MFFFKQKTAYEMRISDGSSDVCSSDLFEPPYFEVVGLPTTYVGHPAVETIAAIRRTEAAATEDGRGFRVRHDIPADRQILAVLPGSRQGEVRRLLPVFDSVLRLLKGAGLNLHLVIPTVETVADRSEEHTSELQSLMRNSYD